MKNKLFVGLLISLLGALLAFTPNYLFPICTKTMETADHMSVPMKCYWSGQAEIGLGALIFVAGLIYLFTNSPKIRQGICYILLLNIFLVLSIPLHLIGGCANHAMPCQLITFPAIYAISGLLLLITLGNLIYLIIQCKYIKE